MILILLINYVLDGPVNMSVSPMKSAYQPGDALTCLADSNPPSIYQWQDAKSGKVIEGATITATGDMVGSNQTFQCVAMNTVRGQQRQSQTTISFIVQKGTII